MNKFMFLLVVIGFASCQPVNRHKHVPNAENKLHQITWILGRWQMQIPEGIIVEEWSKPSDTQWRGVSYMVSHTGDTPFVENIRLDYSGDTLYYMPTVGNQNSGKEISFTEKSFSDSLVVFENMYHDFPQRIIYKKLSDTSIVAAIEGRQNGKDKREEFAYLKAK